MGFKLNCLISAVLYSKQSPENDGDDDEDGGDVGDAGDCHPDLPAMLPPTNCCVEQRPGPDNDITARHHGYIIFLLIN